MPDPSDISHGGGPVPKARRAARLAAVQAVFQWSATGNPIERILREFLTHRLPSPEGRDSYDGADTQYFADLARGVAADCEALDEVVGRALADGWSVDRLDRVLLAILRVGAFEITTRSDVPPRVAINEYVEIAKSFLEDRAASFVNGVLDRLGNTVRAEEMERRPGEEAAQSQ